MASDKQPTVTELASKLEVQLEEFFVKKVPALPENVKEIIVKISPWFAVVSMIFLLPLILGALGLSAILLPASFLGGFTMGVSSIIGLVFSIALIGINLIAIPGLFKRQAKAWKLMFYSVLLSAVQNILTFNIGALVIGGAIGCYFLFQVKDKYNK
ncbi:MAG: hypothetical protein WCL07_01275 [bacterium]